MPDKHATIADAAIRYVRDQPRVHLAEWPTPVHTLERLRCALGTGIELSVKRDDLASFGFGGSKVRHLEVLAAEAVAAGADTLVVAGGLQSNCARLTAAVAAVLGMDAVLLLNGAAPARPTGNLLLCDWLGAQVQLLPSTDDRPAAIASTLRALRSSGKSPFLIPVSAATPTTVIAAARAILELSAQGPQPDVIFVSSSSGATQAGLILGCALAGFNTRVVGVSPDDSSADVTARVGTLLQAAADTLRTHLGRALDLPAAFVDDRFAGLAEAPRDARRRAASFFSRTEGIFLDFTYSSASAAALLDALQTASLPAASSVLWWHTGGQPGLFA